jgi:hypothetical protein
LLFELSRLLLAQQQQEQLEMDYDGNIKSTPISRGNRGVWTLGASGRNMSDKEADYQRSHSVMGINKEFEDEPEIGFVVYDKEQEAEQLQPGKPEAAGTRATKVEKISEASKSKESSQQDKKNKGKFKKQ